jgi:hypothetical protein
LRKQLRMARHERAELEKNVSEMRSNSEMQGLPPYSAAPAADLGSLPVIAAAPCAIVSEMSWQASCHRDMFAKEPWRLPPQPVTQRALRRDGLRMSASAPSFAELAAPSWTLRHYPQGSCVRLTS